MKVVVEVLDGARAGERLTFDGPRSLRFGRHPDNDVAFDAQGDRDASARHAELRLSRHGYRLFDLGSANGTTIDGRCVDRDGVAVERSAEVGFGPAGPRCRLTVLDEPGELPVTLFRSEREPDAASVAPLDSPASRSEPPALVPSAPVPPGPDRRYGASTVAGIVDEALRRERGHGRRQGVVIAAAVAVAAVGSGVGLTLAVRAQPAALRRELASLVEAQGSAGEVERARLQKKIDELARRLGRGVEIARANRASVFLVVARGPSNVDGFCTAFAASRRRLLTNAHCIQLADELRRRGNRIELVPNGGGPARPVLRWRSTAGFRASDRHIGADVGWLEVEADLPAQVELAPQAEVEAISAGDTMSTYGFPGRLADTEQPEATYVAGVIGRVTALDGRPAAARTGQLLQHSAFTSAGTSGSPLFDAEGRVIGINAGGYVDDGAAGRPLPGYNFGMRIDLAAALLNEADE